MGGSHLDTDFIIKSPYIFDSIDIFSDSLFSKDENEANDDNIKLKDYYNVYENKFISASHDFIVDEFIGRKSFFNKYKFLKQRKYNLAQLLIFVPER